MSTRAPRGYLRPGVTLNLGEIVVAGTGHAEADIVNWAAQDGYTVQPIGADPTVARFSCRVPVVDILGLECKF